MITQYFALLSLGSFVAAALIGIGSLSASGRAFWRNSLGPGALGAASVVAVVTTAGSLYLSEVLHYRPCRLCWIQRGFAYPLAIILPLALVTGHRRLHRAVLFLCPLGAAVSAFHILIEHFPSLEGSVTCAVENPCSLIWVRHYGFVTIPTMAFASFLLQLALLSTGWSLTRKASS